MKGKGKGIKGEVVASLATGQMNVGRSKRSHLIFKQWKLEGFSSWRVLDKVAKVHAV